MSRRVRAQIALAALLAVPLPAAADDASALERSDQDEREVGARSVPTPELSDSRGVFSPPARSDPPDEQEVWVELVPAQRELRLASPVAYYDLRGWAGAGQPLEHDVMVAIDTSGSTAVASGSDVDGDGRIGRRTRREREKWRDFNPAYLSNDPGDTVLAAEVLATRRPVERMGAGRTRIGIVSFSNEPPIEVPLVGDTESHGRLSLTLQLSVPPPPFEICSVLLDGFEPPATALNDSDDGLRTSAGAAETVSVTVVDLGQPVAGD